MLSASPLSCRRERVAFFVNVVAHLFTCLCPFLLFFLLCSCYCAAKNDKEDRVILLVLSFFFHIFTLSGRFSSRDNDAVTALRRWASGTSCGFYRVASTSLSGCDVPYASSVHRNYGLLHAVRAPQRASGTPNLLQCHKVQTHRCAGERNERTECEGGWADDPDAA